MPSFTPHTKRQLDVVLDKVGKRIYKVVAKLNQHHEKYTGLQQQILVLIAEANQTTEVMWALVRETTSVDLGDDRNYEICFKEPKKVTLIDTGGGPEVPSYE